MRCAAGELDDFDATLDRAHCVEEHLAMLLADDQRQFLVMSVQQLKVAREDPYPSNRWSGAPGRKRGCRGRDRAVDVLAVPQRDCSDHCARRRVADITAAGAVRIGGRTIDPERDG